MCDVTRGLHVALGFLCPRVCFVCGRPLGRGEDRLCMHCLAQLPRTLAHRDAGSAIAQGLLAVAPSPRAAHWFHYNGAGPWQRLIKAIKYEGMPALAYSLGRTFARELEADGWFGKRPVDVLVPVPVSRERLLVRTYSQALEIARGIAAVTGADVVRALHMAPGHGHQTGRSASQRWVNARAMFKPCVDTRLTGRHIAVVDDVVTTGATVTAAVQALMPSRPASVSVISLARTSN